MQKLAFEQAWDKTLAEKDRFEIQRVFSELDHENASSQNAVILKTAFNHKKEYLVTVLVNNYSKEPFSFLDKKIRYEERGHILGNLVSTYTLEVPAQTSMPWTFIFPAGSLEGTPSGKSGRLTFK